MISKGFGDNMSNYFVFVDILATMKDRKTDGRSTYNENIIALLGGSVNSIV